MLRVDAVGTDHARGTGKVSGGVSCVKADIQACLQLAVFAGS